MSRELSFRAYQTGIALLSTVLLTVVPASAQDVIVDQFADESEVAGKWTRWWGGAEQTYEFDATVDADKKAGSGSLKATIGFDIAAHGGDNQFSLQHYLDTAVDGTKFTQLVFDIRFDPTSPTRPKSGDFGYLEYGLIPGDYSQLYLGNVTVSATAAGWIHVSAPIDPAAPKLDKVIGVTFKLWAGDGNPAGDNRLTGNTVFWVDNIRLVANTSTQPLPPPTLSVRKPVPGLQLFASKPGAQYQRQNIRTTDPSYGWVGNPAPVTYSFTIADYPDGSGKGFQTQLFLVPGTGIPAFETSPDYNEPDVIFVDLQNNADGSAYASFRHKIDQPNGNAMIYGAGTLGGIGNPTALGTWSLTMKDSSATLTTPSGSSTNFTLPAGTVARFAGPLYAYFGVQPNSTANIGRSATFSRIQITGAGTPIDDRFTSGPLDPVTWQGVAEDAPGILPVPADTAYALTWTLPDAGYNLEAGPGLATGLFIDVTARSGPIQIGTRKVALVSGADLPAASGGFFRLRQP